MFLEDQRWFYYIFFFDAFHCMLLCITCYIFDDILLLMLNTCIFHTKVDINVDIFITITWILKCVENVLMFYYIKLLFLWNLFSLCNLLSIEFKCMYNCHLSLTFVRYLTCCCYCCCEWKCFSSSWGCKCCWLGVKWNSVTFTDSKLKT